MSWNLNDGPAQHTEVFATVTDEDLTSAANAGPCVGHYCRWIEVGGPGTLEVTRANGTNVVLPEMPAGHRFVGQYKALVAAGSTATDVSVNW
jgi:hypothetical protein